MSRSSRLPSVSSSNGAAMASGVKMDTGEPRAPAPQPKKEKKENFFDMTEDDIDIWSPSFSKDLKKKSSTGQIAATVVEDTSVERVGGAFIDEEWSLKLPQKLPRATGGKGGKETDGPASSKNSSFIPRSQTYSSSSKGEPQHKGAVRRLDLEYDRVKELEDKVEELELARWQPPSIHEIMNRLLLGKPCYLSWFKSMDDKMNLLDAAIATNDGNCVMAVVLFIKRSVNQSIFLNVLDKRREAAQHYMNFLKKLKSWRDLKALYMRLNHMETLAYFCLQECDAVGLTTSERMRLIKSIPTEFRKVANLRHSEDLQHVEEYSRLIHTQHKIEESSSQGAARAVPDRSIMFQPLTTTLLYCCRHYRGQEKKAGNPEELRKLFNIPDNQFFQVDLLALALRKDWKGIERLVTTKGVLGIGKRKKSPIGFERVVRLLGQERYRAPNDVIISYLDEIDDMEERYLLSMEVGLYLAALDTLIAIRDRERVANFINSVPPGRHYEIRGRIEQALGNSVS